MRAQAAVAYSSLEEEPGNDRSPKSLKNQLSQTCDGETSAAQLAEATRAGDIQWERIDMSSLNAFKNRLTEIISRARS